MLLYLPTDVFENGLRRLPLFAYLYLLLPWRTFAFHFFMKKGGCESARPPFACHSACLKLFNLFGENGR